MAIADEALRFLLCLLLTEPSGRMTERIRVILTRGKRSLQLLRQQTTVETFTYKVVNRELGIMTENIGFRENKWKSVTESGWAMPVKPSISFHGVCL